MKYSILLIAVVLFCSCSTNGQPKKKEPKPLYCNVDSVRKWEANNAISSWSSGGYIGHNGKQYQDTTNFPPRERVRIIGDTVTTDTSVKYENVFLKVSECGECRIYTIWATKKTTTYSWWHRTLYQDSLTAKHYASGSGDWSGTDNEHSIVEYLSKEKTPITNLLIFPNN